MKFFYRLFLFFTFFFFTPLLLDASSLTAYNNQTIYETFNHVFYNDEIAQGFVRLNNGFTVMPDASALMDLLFSVSGDLDLRERGLVRMLKDLQCDSSLSLTTGGCLDGRGYALLLQGDLTIPSNHVLHISGDTIVDAQGHALIVGENAQIFVDTNVTLTIANAVVTSLRNAPSYPPLRLAALNSKLALDNVVFAPADDFQFQQGQLFIHNDVAFTGTGSFIYHSPAPSFITAGGQLMFDQNTTFSCAPASYTDAPYTLKQTYTDNNFFKMADVTSVFYLNGASLQATHTGFGLTRGTLLVDNKVHCISDTTLAYVSATSVFRDDNSGLHAFSWNPNGWFYATGYGQEIRLYYFDGTSTTLYDTQFYGDKDSVVESVHWSPDGKFLAVGGIDGEDHNIKVYYFDGLRLSLWAEADFEIIVSDVRWSPDGKYLAVGGYQPISACFIRVFRFDGTSLPLVAQYDDTAGSVDWSPDGKYLVFGQAIATASAQVLFFDGNSLTKVTSASYGTRIYATRWSPDGKFLAISGYQPTDQYEIQVYRYDGTSLVLCARAVWGRDTIVHSVAWSPDGRYLATCGSRSGTNLVRIYDFNSWSTLTQIDAINLDGTGETVYPINWRSDGKFISVLKDLDPTTYIFRVYYGNETRTQALSKSIVFGNQAQGGDYDLNIRLKPGASINVIGKMLYDNADMVSAAT